MNNVFLAEALNSPDWGSWPDWIVAIFTIIATVFSIVAFRQSILAGKDNARVAEEQNTLNKKQIEIERKQWELANRREIADLLKAWEGYYEINGTDPNFEDVTRSIYLMTFTAAYWNYQIANQDLIYECFWPAFQKMYETLLESDAVVGNAGKKCRDLLSQDISRAYAEMQKHKVNYK